MQTQKAEQAAPAAFEGQHLKLQDAPFFWLRTLVRDYLSSSDRLCLFQVGSCLATVVLQHAAMVTLSPREQSLDAQQHKNAVEAILARAPEVELRVSLSATAVPSCWAGSVKRHVKHLELWSLDLTTKALQQQLQLQHCCKLETLFLHPNNEPSCSKQLLQLLSQQRTQLLPPSLTRLQTNTMGSHGLMEDMIYIAGPQLTHLRYLGSWSILQIDRLSQLTHVQLFELNDSNLDALALLPNLTHVRTMGTWCQEDHTNKQLGWKRLEIYGGEQLRLLRTLPVAHIQQLVIHTCIFGSEAESAAHDIAHLATCPDLQFLSHNVTVNGVPGHSEFIIKYPHPSALVSLCASRMTAKGCIHLHYIDAYGIQEILHSIPSLPEQVELLHLELAQYITDLPQLTANQRAQVLVQVMAALPQHIKQLIIEPEAECYGEAHVYAEAIINHLQSSQQRTKLWVTEPQWRKVPAALKALAKAHPGFISIPKIR